MAREATAKRIPTMALLLAVLVCAGLALLLEAQLKLPVRLPGHRVFPGALALVLLAAAAPRSVLIAFAAVMGVLIALVTQNPLLVLVWLVPATALATLPAASRSARIAIALAAGLGFGALRYLTLPAIPHHTPEAARLIGHLVFGALGALGVAIDAANPPGLRKGP